jgi:hypothetical protein
MRPRQGIIFYPSWGTIFILIHLGTQTPRHVLWNRGVAIKKSFQYVQIWVSSVKWETKKLQTSYLKQHRRYKTI